MEASDDLGARLRRARQRKLLTQVALAEASGIERATISNLERGRVRTTPRYHTIRALALVLRVDPAWLLTGEADDEPQDAQPTKGGAE